jgi:hypothetical protein
MQIKPFINELILMGCIYLIVPGIIKLGFDLRIEEEMKKEGIVLVFILLLQREQMLKFT